MAGQVDGDLGFDVVPFNDPPEVFDFCDECGEPTDWECSRCGTPCCPACLMGTEEWCSICWSDMNG